MTMQAETECDPPDAGAGQGPEHPAAASSQAFQKAQLAPFQSFRIHRLLAGFVLGMIVILPAELVGSLLWERSADVDWPEAADQLELSLIFFSSRLWLLWLSVRMLRRRGLPLRSFMAREPGRSLPAFVGLTLVLLISAFGLNLPVHLFLMWGESPLKTGLPEFWTDGDLLALSYNLVEVLDAVILAPLVEELVFRGIFLHRLTVKWNLRDAIIISSLIFGLMHGLNVSAFVFGLAMSLLYLESANLRVTIACHSLHNAAVAWLGWLVATGYLRYTDDAWLQFEVLCLAVSGSCLLYWFWKREAAWSRLPPFLVAVTPASGIPRQTESR